MYHGVGALPPPWGSGPDPAGDPLPLAKRGETLVGHELTTFNPVLVTLNETLPRHPLEQDRCARPSVIRETKCFQDLPGTQTALLAIVVHWQDRQDRCLVGSTEAGASSEGSEHDASGVVRDPVVSLEYKIPRPTRSVCIG